MIVELHIGPNYAAQAAPLIRDFSTTLVVIDHLAEPQLRNAVEYTEVLALAEFDNVYMKLTELSHFTSDGRFI